MKKKKTAKQIAAIVCIVLLAALYLITLLSAIFAFPGWQRLFSGCLICTVAVPILLWIFIWLYGQFEQKHTIASFDIGQTDADRTQNEDEANAAQKLKRKSAVAPATISRAAALFQLSYTFLRIYSIFLFFSTFIVITHATKISTQIIPKP